MRPSPSSWFRGFSNCWNKRFESKDRNKYTADSMYGPYDHGTYVGSTMNDQASSVRFF